MCWFLCTCASPGAAAQPPLSPEAVTPKAAVFHGCSVCRGTPFRAEWCGPCLSASLRAGPCLWLLSVAVCGLLGRECGGVGAGVRRGEVCLTPLGSAEVTGGEGLGIRPQVRLSVEEIARCRNAIPWAPWLPRPTPPRLGVRDRGAGRVGLWGRPASWFVATTLSPYPHWVEALWGVSCEGADSIHGAPHPPLAYLLKAQFPLRKFGGYRYVSCSDWSQGGGCLKSRLLGGRLGAGVGGPMPLQK